MDTTYNVISDWLSTLPTRSNVGAIVTETDLIDTGVLDSIAVLDLISFVEDRFKVVVPVEDFVPENFRNSAAISSLVKRLVGHGS